MNNDDEKLDSLLRQWQCEVSSDTDLEAKVWRKIAIADESTWRGGSVVQWFGHRLAGPAVAAGLVLAATLGGIGAAELKVQRDREFASLNDPERAYFDSINPIALAARGGHQH